MAEIDPSTNYCRPPTVFYANRTGFADTAEGTRRYFSWSAEDGVLREVQITRDEFMGRLGDEPYFEEAE